MSAAAFHARERVAQLKLYLFPGGEINLITFHARERVAQLKLSFGGRTLAAQPPFHARERVAQLKPNDIGADNCCVVVFPRARARGPIEASCWLRVISTSPVLSTRESAWPN